MRQDILDLVRFINAQIECKHYSIQNYMIIHIWKRSSALDREFHEKRIVSYDEIRFIGMDEDDYLYFVVAEMTRRLINHINEEERNGMTMKYLNSDNSKAVFDAWRNVRWTYGNSMKLDLLPKKVIFNPPATIVIWQDDTKTTIKKQSDEELWDPEKALAMCYMKKLFGNASKFNDVLKKYVKEEETE